MLVLANLAGETTVSGIAQWGQVRAAWVGPLLQVPQGRLPCATTYTLLCAKGDGTALNRRFAQLFVPPVPPVSEAPQPTAPCATPAPRRAQRHLALEGTTLRGTRRSGVVAQPAVDLLRL